MIFRVKDNYEDNDKYDYYVYTDFTTKEQILQYIQDRCATDMNIDFEVHDTQNASFDAWQFFQYVAAHGDPHLSIIPVETLFYSCDRVAEPNLPNDVIKKAEAMRANHDYGLLHYMQKDLD